MKKSRKKHGLEKIYTIIKQKLELKKKSESWAIGMSAGVIFFDISPLNK